MNRTHYLLGDFRTFLISSTSNICEVKQENSNRHGNNTKSSHFQNFIERTLCSSCALRLRPARGVILPTFIGPRVLRQQYNILVNHVLHELGTCWNMLPKCKENWQPSALYSRQGRQSWGGHIPPTFWTGGDTYIVIPPTFCFEKFKSKCLNNKLFQYFSL